MVISHKYKYVFIENPRTGTSSIRKELVEKYDGKVILQKHATYSEFMAQASDDEKKYYVFIGIRNPLDRVVSDFVKRKVSKSKSYKDALELKGRKRFFEARRMWSAKRIKKDNYTFYKYLKEIKNKPYDDMSTMYRDKFDGIIRFESLNNDFEKILNEIGIRQKEKLSLFNKTPTKKNYLKYYENIELKKMALEKCHIFMNIWGYKIPDGWPIVDITLRQKFLWNIFHVIRFFSWNYLRRGLKDHALPSYDPGSVEEKLED